ncbi:TonB-dependent receptor [Larkinella punicea]|uniref:TonB-dependent receptor n=1 Tax=Larkinella punicea TaxID=2315727 RepID=A0A368JFU1_9BACT|nr:TonB-dependent receptor [Larkinella punicea]RCR65554.1 TonB-dependent receptor [Larkinella punicea]
MRIHYWLLILLLAGLQVQRSAAQAQVSISGYVTDDKTNEPIPNVAVQVRGTKMGALSDATGAFRVKNVLTGTVKLRFSSVGYRPLEKSFAVTADLENLTVQLAAELTELQTVEVTATSEEQAEEKKIRSNVMPVTIITAKQIENRAGNLNEVLARQAGVQIRMSGGLGSDSRISVRGLEGKRVQIFIDGNPLNTPDGSLGINDLPVQIIERIEIYKGSVPAWLGGDGLGSAVNVVMRHRDVSYIDATVSRQSYNTLSLGLILKKTFEKSGIELGVGAFDTRSDNDYIIKSPYQPDLKIKRDHDFYHSLLVGRAIRFHKLWFDEIEIESAYVLNKKQIQGIQENIQHVESRGEAGVSVISFTKKNFANNKLGLRYNVLYGKFNVKFIDTSAYNYDWEGRRIPSRIGRGELGIGPNLSTNLQRDLRHRFNLDYRLNEFITLNLNNTARYVTFDPNDDVGNAFAGTNRFNYPGSVRNSITGLTLETRLPNDQLLLSAAVKQYYNRVKGYNTSLYVNNSTPDPVDNLTNVLGYNAGFRYNFSPALLAKGSYERGVRLPNNTELFGDGILITPTTYLKPELAHNYNLGLVYDRTDSEARRLQIEVNGFYMNVENLIQLSGNGLTLGYVNYAKANIKGADIDVKYDLTQHIYTSVNATYQIPTDINRVIPETTVPNPTYGLQVPNTPQLFANWNLEFHRQHLFGKDSKTRIIYDGSFVNRYSYGFNISVYDRFFIPTYLTHTLSVEQSFRQSRYTFTGEVNNLTNENVINNFNQPLMGRTVRVKFRYLLFGPETHDHTH